MEPSRANFFLLRSHMLHFDAPRVGKPSGGLLGGARESGAQAGSGASHSLSHDATVGGGGSSGAGGSNPKRIFPNVGVAGSENLNFIFQHITAVHRTESQLRNQRGKTNTTTGQRGTSAGESATFKSQLGLEIENAVYCLLKTAERFPSPQLPLIELIRCFVMHMSYHRTSAGVVPGEYIVKALMHFFGVDRNEAFGRYAIALVNCGCIMGANAKGMASNSSSSYGSTSEFEKSFFLCQVPSQVDDLSQLIDLRETASRMLCLYCSRAVQEGSSELLYLSHSRWLFGPPPQREVENSSPGGRPLPTNIDDGDSPFSPFPSQLKRQLLGPLAQYVASFCMSECKLQEALQDQCAIVRIDGVKFALAQLCGANNPVLIKNPENGKMERCDAPVTLLMGFPEHTQDSVIHVGVKKLLDAVELCEGPRRLLGYGQSAEAFRAHLRCLGSRMFSLATEIFFRPEAPNTALCNRKGVRSGVATKGSDADGGGSGSTKGELCSLLDEGVEDQMQHAYRVRRPCNGFPTICPFALNHRASTHALTRRSCSVATQILLSIRDACAPFGGCAALALFYHGNLVVADSHPFVSALLGLRARWSFYEVAPPPTNLDETTATLDSASQKTSCVVGTKGELWSASPVRSQMPVGIFSDSAFGEPRDVSKRTPQSSSDAASAEVSASQQPSSPGSPRAVSPQSSNDDIAASAIAALHPHLFHIVCYLSEEIAPLVTLPYQCPRSTVPPAQRDGSTPQRPSRGASPQKDASPGVKLKYNCVEGHSRGDEKDETKEAGPQQMRPGFYHGAHLSSNGVDVVVLLPLLFEAPGSPATAEVTERITETFMKELSTVARDMNSLSMHMARADSVPREIEPSSNGGKESGGSSSEDGRGSSALGGSDGHHNVLNGPGGADSSQLLGSASGLTSSAGVTVSKEVAMTAPLCLVHDLALGVAEFLDGVFGCQEDVAHQQRVVPSSLALNRATVFHHEVTPLANLLGGTLRLPRRHPDDTNSSDYPFATEPITRAILGRNAFGERDKKGPHNVLFGRQSGGQQAFFGVPVVPSALSSSAAASALATGTLRNVEELYVQYVSASKAHTVVV